MTCPICGQLMSVLDRKCPHCNAIGSMQVPSDESLSAEFWADDEPLDVIQLAAVRPLASPSSAMPAATLGHRYCTNCGTPNVGTAAFCLGCGQNLSLLAPAPPNPYATPQPAPPSFNAPIQLAPLIQNNVNVVITQQNNNQPDINVDKGIAQRPAPAQKSSGCLPIVGGILAFGIAGWLAPTLIGIFIAYHISKSTTIDQGKRIIGIACSLVVGIVLNIPWAIMISSSGK